MQTRVTFHLRNGLFRDYQALLGGLKWLKLNRNRRAAYWQDHFAPDVSRFANASRRQLIAYALATSWNQAIFLILIGVLLALAALVDLGTETLTSFAVLALYMRGSINVVLNTLPSWSNAEMAMTRLEKLGLLLEKEREPTALTPPVDDEPPIMATVSLHDVAHRYQTKDEEGFLLGPINLEIRPGELLFMIGANGSGKTTLGKLLTGLYWPEQGEIRLNDEPVTPAMLEEYRQLFTAGLCGRLSVRGAIRAFSRRPGYACAGLFARVSVG